jgi:hypothetical protein
MTRYSFYIKKYKKRTEEETKKVQQHGTRLAKKGLKCLYNFVRTRQNPQKEWF